MTSSAEKHTHRAARSRGPYGYTGPVAHDRGVPGTPRPERNEAAHGGVMWVEICSCGCERRVLVNGLHREYGRWRRSEAQREADKQRESCERRLLRAREMLARAHEALPGGRTVSVAAGIRLVLPSHAAGRPEALLDDDTRVEVVLDGPYPAHRGAARLGDLRLAGRQWEGGPAGDVRTAVYPAIARALP